MIDINRLINEAINNVVYHASGMDFNKFDLKYSKSNTEMARHGLGVYFINDYDTALKYIEIYTPNQKGIIYYCKLYDLDTYVDWNILSDESLYIKIANDLIDTGFDNDGQRLLDDYNSYGETINNGSLYDYVKHVVGSKEVNQYFTNNNVYGFIGSNIMNPDAIEYCCLDASNLYIQRKEEVQI